MKEGGLLISLWKRGTHSNIELSVIHQINIPYLRHHILFNLYYMFLICSFHVAFQKARGNTHTHCNSVNTLLFCRFPAVEQMSVCEHGRRGGCIQCNASIMSVPSLNKLPVALLCRKPWHAPPASMCVCVCTLYFCLVTYAEEQCLTPFIIDAI